MKIVIVVFLLSLTALCQTKATVKPAAHKPTTAERLDKLESSLQQTVQSRDDLKAENERLKAANKELSDSNIALSAKYEELRKSAFEVLQFGTRAANEYEKANAINGDIVAKYNNLLSRANDVINAQNARLAQQARVSNALAIYSMMPRYTPVQLAPPLLFTPAPQAPLKLSPEVVCRSVAVGNEIRTECN